ncbi:hypothetical protein ACIQZG_20960 [Lysinibacillus sp. NPDC096418]|uniref:hypothetical protein n=1 Tax=Lysinibacillus sp. NPDC096418 TaxID=3364138 RepID=UPI00380220F6
MTVNKIIIEAHSNPKGLYQVRWQVKGMPDGVSDEMLDMGLFEAYHAAQAVKENLKMKHNIVLKPKNIIVIINDVKKLAHRDNNSMIWLTEKGCI